jgi:hypothetical protein
MDKHLTRVLEDVAALSSGLILIVVSFYLGYIGLLSFLIGCILTACPTVDFCLMLRTTNKNFLSNKQGLVWIWIVGLGLAIPFSALVYWTLDYPFDLIRLSTADLYTFTGAMASTWMVIQAAISYLLAVVLIYAVIWVIMNSKSPQQVYM